MATSPAGCSIPQMFTVDAHGLRGEREPVGDPTNGESAQTKLDDFELARRCNLAQLEQNRDVHGVQGRDGVGHIPREGIQQTEVRTGNLIGQSNVGCVVIDAADEPFEELRHVEIGRPDVSALATARILDPCPPEPDPINLRSIDVIHRKDDCLWNELVP